MQPSAGRCGFVLCVITLLATSACQSLSLTRLPRLHSSTLTSEYPPPHTLASPVSENPSAIHERELDSRRSGESPECHFNSTSNCSTDASNWHCRPLCEFYQATGGETRWKDRDGWGLPGRPACVLYNSWIGITCSYPPSSATPIITAIKLSGNDLRGTLPDTLSQLSGLATLDFNSNTLSGTLPSSLSMLSDLAYLSMENNMLSGTLIDLPAMHRDPASLEAIETTARVLEALLGNGTEHISDMLSKVAFYDSMNIMSFQSNNISGTMPQSLTASTGGSYCGLNAWLMAQNRISGTVPPDLLSCPHLVLFSVRGNSMSGTLPNATVPSHPIRYLDLFGNQKISGSIPSKLVTSLSGIVYLSAAYNRLSGNLPAALNSLKFLITLDMSSNRLSGTIAKEILEFPLHTLGMGDNRFSGTLAVFPNVLNLYLQQNSNLSGTIPRSTGSMLTRLFFFESRVSGTIPSAWGSFSNAHSIFFNHNRVSGTLPQELSKWSSVTTIYFSSNMLSGTLPREFDTMQQLSSLYLSSNGFSGSIPSEFASMTTLENLLLGLNAVSGSVPASLSGLTELRLLGLGSNSLSGSSAPSFGKWSRLELFAINDNSRLDWDLGLLTQWPKVQNVLASGCAIRGTLPDSLLENAASLETLNLGQNSLSGTLGASFFAGSSALRTVVLSGNTLSGSLPASLGTLGRLTAFLANNMALSGTIPVLDSQPSAYKPGAFAVESGPCVTDADAACVTSPNFPSAYGSSEDCSIRVAWAGYVEATAFATERYDILSTNGSAWHGTASFPPNVKVGSGQLMTWQTDNSVVNSGWRLCFSLLRQPILKTFSVSRNRLEGSTEALTKQDSLQTLVLSSNRFSCDAVELDGAVHLGEGNFKDPGVEAMLTLGKRIALDSPYANPFSDADAKYTNVALVFAGNPSMTTASSYLTRKRSSRLIQHDEIRQGRIGLFPEYTSYKQLVWLVLPCLVLLHLIVVWTVARVYGEPVSFYLRRSLARVHSTRSRVLEKALKWLSRMSLCGMVLAVLNVASPHVYDDHGCDDPLLRTTTEPVVTKVWYQWLWVVLAGVVLACTSRLMEVLKRAQLSDRARSVYRCVHTFVGQTEPRVAAIDVWRAKLPHKVNWWRQAAFSLLHLPFLALASAPAFGFVLSQNVPSGSSVWLTLIGNPAVVAVVNVVWSAALVPRIAGWLSRVRHGVRSPVDVQPAVVISLYKTQVGTILIFDLVSVLLAPMLSVLALDESCLRHYLAFAPELEDLMSAWGIAQRGLEAYRPGFCSRRLLSQFAYVWIVITLMATLLTPTQWLLSVHPKVQPLVRRLEARFSSAVTGGYAETLERAATVQNDIVKVLVLTLTVVIFGTLVPPLLLLAPVAGWLQLCAMDLVERNKSDMFWGQVLASNVLVQVPLSKVSLLARVGMWGGACFVFVDLEFALGPVLVYALFAALEVTVSAYRWRKIRTTASYRPPCDALGTDLVVFSRHEVQFRNPLVSSPAKMPTEETVTFVPSEMTSHGGAGEVFSQPKLKIQFRKPLGS